MSTPKKRLEFDILINASPENVWATITGDAEFRDWCAAFNPGSHFVGDWSEGSEIRFLGETEEGIQGMLSKVIEHTMGRTLVLEHIGMIQDGQAITEGEAVEVWAPAREEYHLTITEGGSRLLVYTDTPESYAEFFEDTWPKALARLKEIAESKTRP